MVAEIINASQSEMRALLLHFEVLYQSRRKSLRKGVDNTKERHKQKLKPELIWDVEDVHLNSSIGCIIFPNCVQELLPIPLRHAKAKELEVRVSHQVDKTCWLHC